MSLTIYRYHSAECRRRLTGDLKIPVKALRQYGRGNNTHCNCVIWLTGTTETGQFYQRASTRLRDWDAALALVRTLDAKGKDTAVHGLTLEECTRKSLDGRTNRVGSRTLGQYKLVLDRLNEFATERSKMFIRDLDVDLCEDFLTYRLSHLKATSKATSAAKLRAFLKEAFRRGWITEALAEKVEAPVATYEHKKPFTEAQVASILAGAADMKGGVSAYAKYPKTLRLLLETMLETGMRCGDAIRFDPAGCVMSDSMWKYTYIPQKTRRDKEPKPAVVYLSVRLKEAIDLCEWMSAQYPFAYLPVDLKDEKKDKTTYMANEVYERMKAIGARCCDGSGKPTPIVDCRPHRLRHTFAVRLLKKGVSVDDVSKLLNHSSVTVTERHYAPWVEARRKRLEELFHKASKKED